MGHGPCLWVALLQLEVCSSEKESDKGSEEGKKWLVAGESQWSGSGDAVWKFSQEHVEEFEGVTVHGVA